MAHNYRAQFIFQEASKTTKNNTAKTLKEDLNHRSDYYDENAFT